MRFVEHSRVKHVPCVHTGGGRSGRPEEPLMARVIVFVVVALLHQRFLPRIILPRSYGAARVRVPVYLPSHGAQR